MEVSYSIENSYDFGDDSHVSFVSSDGNYLSKHQLGIDVISFLPGFELLLL